MHTEIDRSQVASSFRSDGFVVLREFLNADAIREVRTNIERYIRDVVPGIPPTDKFYENKDDVSTLKQLQRIEQHDRTFSAMLRDGRFPELARLLLEDDVVPKGIEYFNKPLGVGRATPAHQDGYYFMLTPCEAVTMWLALDDVDAENGCLRYVRGSHRRGVRPHARTQTLGFSQGITDYGSADDAASEVVCTARPGDLLVHHALCVHRADANQSRQRGRRAMGFVYFAARAREDKTALDAYQKSLTQDLAATGKI